MNILVLDPFPKAFMDDLVGLGHPVKNLNGKPLEEILEALPEAEIILINSRINLKSENLALAQKLRLVCRAGVGLDHFDLDLMQERGIKVVNAPGANALPVAEQALGMLLTMMHSIHNAANEVRAFEWNREKNRGTELSGLKVGIIGYGNIGSAFARLLKGFECEVLAFDKYEQGFGGNGVREASLEEIKQEVQVLSLHVPLTEETRGMVDYPFLKEFAHPVWLMNLARGGVIKQADMNRALDEGLLCGLALDVLENEKLAKYTEAEKDSLQKLVNDPRVIVTPHIGGWSHQSLKRINDLMFNAIKEFLADQG